MRLQVAIDRVTIEEALKLVNEFDGLADIIEIGTSLIKDYGLLILSKINLNKNKNKSLILGDIKTIDEGAYEFEMGYKCGFDILTVMGNSSLETIEKCYEVSKKYRKGIMIDLLECSEDKIRKISNFKDAIYCIHTSTDKKNQGSFINELEKFNKEFPNIKHIAVSGGVKLENIEIFKNYNIDIVVVGSAITSKENPRDEVSKFKGEFI